MADENLDNHLKPENRQNQLPEDEFIPDDALPFCPQCLKPCNPLQYYCDNCDSNETISPLASYMPFVYIRLSVAAMEKCGVRFGMIKMHR